MGTLVDALRDIKYRIDSQAAPSGTQYAQAVKRLGELIDAIPVGVAVGENRSGFTVAANTSWNRYGYAAVTVPEGKTECAVFARANASVNSENMYRYTVLQGRILIDGQAGRSFDCSYMLGAASNSPINYKTSGFATRTFTVEPGQVIPVEFQMRRNDSSLPMPTDSRNASVLNVKAVFT
ncbi:hypothetical protein [Microbacterium sp. MPKO10]|uniref:hypothetical protein n=1 Tax=Microbacterium sp. MPKO10 TaxID=2989818 RepID=UPI0022359E43|nr:hypothetical protein [Microbacterium sp. MPKO10]MCW4458193.1 hypothetical protein [Microbacterium sp. MPKO10]